jgi:hypothetical protein
MSRELLRDGWPAAVLGGHYAVIRRELRGSVVRDVASLVEPELFDSGPTVWEVAVDGRIEYRTRDTNCLKLERGPRTAVLRLRGRQQPRRSWLEVVREVLRGDHLLDVYDPRLNTRVGSVVERRHRDAPFKWHLLDPAGRGVAVLGRTMQLQDPSGAVVGLLTRGPYRRGTLLNVDLSGLADRVDPRLILACALLAV